MPYPKSQTDSGTSHIKWSRVSGNAGRDVYLRTFAGSLDITVYTDDTQEKMWSWVVRDVYHYKNVGASRVQLDEFAAKNQAMAYYICYMALKLIRNQTDPRKVRKQWNEL